MDIQKYNRSMLKKLIRELEMNPREELPFRGFYYDYIDVLYALRCDYENNIPIREERLNWLKKNAPISTENMIRAIQELVLR